MCAFFIGGWGGVKFVGLGQDQGFFPLLFVYTQPDIMGGKPTSAVDSDLDDLTLLL